MIRIFKRNIYNNLIPNYNGLSFKKTNNYIKNKSKYIKIPKYLNLTLEELIKNRENINELHRMIYIKK